MSLADVTKMPMKRLNPYRGLVIDVPTWSEAHSYHRDQQRVHALAMHSPGVAVGLEVVAHSPADNTVVVLPGVAIDPEGNTFVVAEPIRFPVQIQQKGTAYLVLHYRESPQEISRSAGGQEPQARYILEGYVLEERRQPPRETGIELARIEISGQGAAILDCEDNAQPRQDQIDLRFRPVAGARTVGEVVIGLLPSGSAPDEGLRHQPGALGLARTINGTTNYRAQFVGVLDAKSGFRDCNLLLMAGHGEFNLDEESESALRHFLDAGGVLLGEACGAGGTGTQETEPFQRSFIRLVDHLGRRLETVRSGHSIFTQLHLFSGPPDGVDGPVQLFAGDGIIYGGGDYGCLWRGGKPERPVPRESIRSAMELGINLGLYAAQRTHLRTIRATVR